MFRYHAVTRNGCQSHVSFLLELSGPRSNRTMESPQTIVFLTDLGQRNYLIRIRSSMQATPLDQDFYGVCVYSPQSQYKSWIPDGSTNTMRRVKCEISVTVTSRKCFVPTPKPFDPILSRCPPFRITFSTI